MAAKDVPSTRDTPAPFVLVEGPALAGLLPLGVGLLVPGTDVVDEACMPEAVLFMPSATVCTAPIKLPRPLALPLLPRVLDPAAIN